MLCLIELLTAIFYFFGVSIVTFEVVYYLTAHRNHVGLPQTVKLFYLIGY